MNEKHELVDELNDLATRFGEGWHKGIEIDASDIMTLGMAADRITELEQQRDELLDVMKRAQDLIELVETPWDAARLLEEANAKARGQS